MKHGVSQERVLGVVCRWVCPETISILGAGAGKVTGHYILEDPELPSRKPAFIL